jgi:hypothetical protein
MALERSSAIFFTPGDIRICPKQMQRLISHLRN